LSKCLIITIQIDFSFLGLKEETFQVALFELQNWS